MLIIDDILTEINFDDRAGERVTTLQLVTAHERGTTQARGFYAIVLLGEALIDQDDEPLVLHTTDDRCHAVNLYHDAADHEKARVDRLDPTCPFCGNATDADYGYCSRCHEHVC